MELKPTNLLLEENINIFFKQIVKKWQQILNTRTMLNIVIIIVANGIGNLNSNPGLYVIFLEHTNHTISNLLSFLLRCGTKPNKWGSQWDSNSLVWVCQSSLLNITPPDWFGLVSLFNGTSTFGGYLIPKPFS